jgi:hypothetical protein
MTDNPRLPAVAEDEIPEMPVPPPVFRHSLHLRLTAENEHQDTGIR